MVNVLSNRVVVRHPAVSLRRTLEHLLRHRRFPYPHYLVTHPDRSQSADYANMDGLSAHRRYRIETAKLLLELAAVVSPEAWFQGLAEIDRMVQKIQQRGGVVVFVRMPTTDEHLALDQE